MPVTKEDALNRFTKIVVEHLGADPAKVTEQSNFVDDLGADSLDEIELIMAVEEAFNIEVGDDAADTLKTVGDVVNYLVAQPAAE